MENEKRNIFLLSMAQIMSVSSVVISVTFAGLVGQILSPDPRFATVPVAIAVFGAAIFAVPVSMTMKKFGRKNIFHLGAVLGVTSGIISCYAIYSSNFSLFCFAALIHGIYQAISGYYRFAAIEVSQVNYHKIAISLVLAGGLVAAFAGTGLAGKLNQIIYPATYIGCYIAVIILGMIAQIPISLLKFPAPVFFENSDKETHAPVKVMDILKRPIFLMAAINGAGGYLLMSFVMTASPLAILGCGFGIGEATSAIQWHTFAMFFPAFFTGFLIQKFGALKMIIAGIICMLATAVTNLLGQELVNFYTGLMIVGLGWNFMFTAGTAWVAESYQPHEKALAQGVNDFIVFGTTGIASLSSGIIYAQYGWERLNYIVFAIIILLVTITVILSQIQKRKNCNYKLTTK